MSWFCCRESLRGCTRTQRSSLIINLRLQTRTRRRAEVSSIIHRAVFLEKVMSNNIVPVVVLLLALVCSVELRQRPIPGGYGHEKDADSEVKALVSSLHDAIEKKTQMEWEKVEALKYRRQIVSGVNFIIKVIATGCKQDGKEGAKQYMHLKIYKPLRGPPSVREVKMITNPDDPINPLM